jgi:hypothetical protein
LFFDLEGPDDHAMIDCKRIPPTAHQSPTGAEYIKALPLGIKTQPNRLCLSALWIDNRSRSIRQPANCQAVADSVDCAIRRVDENSREIKNPASSGVAANFGFAILGDTLYAQTGHSH